ncbi:hypothetical protein GA0115253_108733 [Streptomyces sp. Termitarium-T10T-6]|nr:hypothetical protein GA0115253_108733 [Streptomyces sp. Termitarium-T10T-6]
MLLTGCGGDADKASVPEGWGTLETGSLSVGYPKSEGYAEQPAAERAKANAAVALKEEDGVRTGMVSVQLDFATGVHDAAGAAAAAGAGIGLNSTRKATDDVRLAGPEDAGEAREARRIDYDFTSDGQEDTPNRGTPMTGVLVAGVDVEGRSVRGASERGEGRGEGGGPGRVRGVDHREVGHGEERLGCCSPCRPPSGGDLAMAELTIDAVVFDVLGTLVDEPAGLRAGIRAPDPVRVPVPRPRPRPLSAIPLPVPLPGRFRDRTASAAVATAHRT